MNSSVKYVIKKTAALATNVGKFLDKLTNKQGETEAQDGMIQEDAQFPEPEPTLELQIDMSAPFVAPRMSQDDLVMEQGDNPPGQEGLDSKLYLLPNLCDRDPDAPLQKTVNEHTMMAYQIKHWYFIMALSQRFAEDFRFENAFYDTIISGARQAIESASADPESVPVPA